MVPSEKSSLKDLYFLLSSTNGEVASSCEVAFSSSPDSTFAD